MGCQRHVFIKFLFVVAIYLCFALLRSGKLYFTLRFWIIQTSQRLRQHGHVERVRQTWVEILDPLLTVTLDAVFNLSEPFFSHL